jgi:two-component system cell cycle sensor histidine kinase PleC
MLTRSPTTGEAPDASQGLVPAYPPLTEAWQRAMVNSADVSSIATDLTGTIRIFTAGAERLFGYAAADMTSRALRHDLFDPPEPVARGADGVYEVACIRQDGRRVPAQVAVTALRDAHGVVIGRLFVCNEMAPLPWQASIAGMREGIQIIDRRWRHVYVNAAAAKQSIYSSAELTGRTMMECYPGIESVPLFAVLKTVMDTGVARQLDTEFLFPDGTRRWFDLSIEPDANGILIRSMDLTEQRIAVQALHKAGELQRAMFTSATFSVVITDEKGDIQVFNAGAERMLGYAAAEVVNRMTPADLSDPEELVARATALSLERGTPVALGFDALVFKASRQIEDIYELTYIRKDRSRLPAVVSVTALRDSEQAIIGYLLIGTDNTARHQVELLRRDQRRFKDEFLSHVSHELRSPLTAIKQFSTILLNGLAGELNKEQRQYQEIVVKNIRQLQAMIDDLLEVTRLETGQLPLDLAAVSVSDTVLDVIETLQVTAAAKGVTLAQTIDAGLPFALADPMRLRQILIILLDNAVKFTPAGGAVTVRVHPLQEDPRRLLLEVSDTGCGISPDMTTRVFERLYQESTSTETSRKGLGLGLYICKELVTRQGGHIWVTRGLVEGTTFSFTLPVVSVDTSMAPLLTGDRWPGDTVALIAVEASLPTAWPSSEAEAEWAHEARSLLLRCLRRDRDSVLPTVQVDQTRRTDRFFVA